MHNNKASQRSEANGKHADPVCRVSVIPGELLLLERKVYWCISPAPGGMGVDVWASSSVPEAEAALPVVTDAWETTSGSTAGLAVVLAAPVRRHSKWVEDCVGPWATVDWAPGRSMTKQTHRRSVACPVGTTAACEHVPDSRSKTQVFALHHGRSAAVLTVRRGRRGIRARSGCIEARLVQLALVEHKAGRKSLDFGGQAT